MRRIATILLGMMCCWVAQAQQHNQQLEKLNYTYNYLQNNYIEDIDFEPLVTEAIKATLKELDPHTSYLTQQEMKQMLNSINGEFSGIGANVAIHNDTLIITRILPASPSEAAGLKKNDRILSVSDTTLVGLERKRAVEHLRGPRGSIASLVVLRGGKELHIDVTRDDIPTKSVDVAYMLNDSVAYVRVDSFLSRTTTEEFKEAIKPLGDMQAMIIDLRGNSGGLLASAIKLSELFLERGDAIVSTEGRKGITRYQSSQSGKYRDIPLAILVDESTASASEVFAGALQDQDRAVIIGRRTFGKGLIQKLVKFKDETGARITIARYKTPSGRIIQRPYRLGEAEEYNANKERYNHPDSMLRDTLPRYTTLRSKRTVYGGGGITPDIYIAKDSLTAKPFTRAMVKERIAQKVIIEFFDRTSIDEFVTLYPTLSDYVASFTLDDHSRELMKSLVAKRDETLLDDSEGIAESIRVIEAQIAEEVYGEGSYYYIYGRERDNTLKRAINIVSSPSLLTDILGGKEIAEKEI